jgi:hypothetical protein
MKRIALSLFAAAFLTAPALADSLVVTGKPMVVAQGVGVGGVRVDVGDRDRERDVRRHRRDGDVIVIRKHRDREHYGEHRRD